MAARWKLRWICRTKFVHRPSSIKCGRQEPDAILWLWNHINGACLRSSHDPESSVGHLQSTKVEISRDYRFLPVIPVITINKKAMGFRLVRSSALYWEFSFITLMFILDTFVSDYRWSYWLILWIWFSHQKLGLELKIETHSWNFLKEFVGHTVVS